MPGQFDAYHRWLGIKPKDQPPHHYRLLGIDIYESDPEVIENAADQRMSHLRTLSTGPRAAEAQRLLNEVAAARLCLLNGEKKMEYDWQLRSTVGESPSAVPVSAGKPSSQPAAVPMGIPAPTVSPVSPASRLAPHRKQSPLPMLLVAGGVLSLIAVVVVIAISLSLPSGDGDPVKPENGMAVDERRDDEATGSPSPVTPTPAEDGWIDLLAALDPERDFLKGEAKLQDGKLTVIGEAPTIVRLPLKKTPENYELLVEVVRHKWEGRKPPTDTSVDIGLDIGYRRVRLLLDGYASRGPFSGLDAIDYHRLVDPENPTHTAKRALLADDRRATVVAIVRRTPDDKVFEVTAKVDGEQIVSFRGDREQFSAALAYHDVKSGDLFVGSWNREVTFEKIVLRPLTPLEPSSTPMMETAPDRPAQPETPSPPAKPALAVEPDEAL